MPDNNNFNQQNYGQNGQYQQPGYGQYQQQNYGQNGQYYQQPQQPYGQPQQPQYQQYPQQGQPLTKWNWGAFMMSILFGFGNKAYLTLLCFVPFLNMVWIFISGFKGEEWSWNSGCYDEQKSFRAAMDSWNRAGFVSFIIALIAIVFSIIFSSVIIAMISTLSQSSYNPY